ncbi:Hypothetical predicted protein [Podarcis lilfordi]|uniref:Uncharacterized protein n=1 Tax=Podarcis lilfordi TaxID=74358 RepID=A0AA35PKE2_9SAUR|nr:Hypothetical predicted protein [Podarcis lilfordi]
MVSQPGRPLDGNMYCFTYRISEVSCMGGGAPAHSAELGLGPITSAPKALPLQHHCSLEGERVASDRVPGFKTDLPVAKRPESRITSSCRTEPRYGLFKTKTTDTTAKPPAVLSSQHLFVRILLLLPPLPTNICPKNLSQFEVTFSLKRSTCSRWGGGRGGRERRSYGEKASQCWLLTPDSYLPAR